jgi:hypothetical protein
MPKSPAPLSRWRVCIPYRHDDGRTGVHVFVVDARNHSHAVHAAWGEAHQPPAVARRGGARLTARRWMLTADQFN